MYFLNQIISGGPGLFFVAVLWIIIHRTLKSDLRFSWPPFCYLFHRQRTTNPYKQDQVLAKGLFFNSPAGPSLSPAFYPPGLTPVIKSNRPDFRALLSGSVQKAGFLLGIFVFLSFSDIQAATKTSTGTGGKWSAATTWVGGAIPANGDDVTIAAGATVTIDTNSTVGSLLISGTLEFEAITARSITVLTQVTISSRGVFRSAQSGTIKNHQLIVEGSIINDGILDFSSNSNATGVEIVFTGSSNAIFSCSDAPLTNLKQTNGITLNKGTSAASVLSFTPGDTFQVLSDGSSGAKGFLSVINGTFNIIGSNRFSNPVFNTEGGYNIPATGGFWLGNQNATVIGMNGTVTNLGDLKITNGTYYVGMSGESSLETLADGQFKMSGGTLNIAGHFKMDGGNATISGGRINLSTQANSADQMPTLSMSGQTNLELYGTPVITISYPNSKTIPFNDIQIEVGGGRKSVTGGTIQLGIEATPVGSSFFVNGDPILNRLTVFNECTIQVFNTSKSDLASTPISSLPKIAFDKIAPELTAPPKLTIQCGENLPKGFASMQEFTNAGGIATDNCTLVPASFKLLGQVQSSANCPYTVTRTYEVSDGSGNLATAEHLIVVEGGAVETPTDAVAESPVKEELKLKSAMANYTAVSGNWSNPATWGGTVPTATDNVTIPNGVIVTVDAAAVCNNITVQAGGTLNYSGVNTLQVYGNWTNSGTYNGGTNGIVEFIGSSNAIISGTTNFEELKITKGSLNTTLTISGNTSVTSGGSLLMTSGLVAIPAGGSFTVNPSSALNIPITSGFDLSGGALSTGNFSITNEGLIRITSGTANFGTNSGNSVHNQVDGAFIVSGGTVNIAGRLENSASGTLVPPGVTSGISISGGTITLATVGNGLSNVGSLNVTSAGNFNFTGGTIAFQNESSATTAIDLGLIGGGGTKTTIGGTFQFGNGSTPAGTIFNISSEILLNRVTSSANADIKLDDNITIGQLALNPSTTIDLNGNQIQLAVTSTGTYTFPLDNGSGVSIPVSVQLTSGTFAPGAYITLESTGADHPNNASATNFLNRYWTVTTSGITNPIYNVTATYADGDIAGTETEMAMGSYVGGLSPWMKYGNANTGANTLSATGITATSFVFTGITSDPPTVDITNGASVAICSGSSVNLTATASGDPTLTYSWSPATGLSATNVSNPVANPTATNNYMVTVTDGNGFTATDVITVTVNQLPTAPTATSPQAFCISATIADLSASAPVGSTVRWYSALSGGSALAVGTALTSGTTYYAESENTTTLCVSTSRTAVVVTIRPTPTATISGTTTVCQNAPTPAVTITNPMALPVAVTYNINGGGTTTLNLPANDYVTVSQPTTAAGVFNYNLVSVAYQTAPTCSNSVSGIATVTVNPIPTVNPIAPQTYCNGFFTSAIVPSGPVAGTTFTWTNSNIAIGLAASGTGNIPAFTTTNGTSAPISGTITVTPTANGCPGTPLTFTIIVNPTLTASISGSTSVCQNAVSPLITFTNNLGLPVTITYNRNLIAQTPVLVAANNTATVAVPTTTAGTFNYALVSIATQSSPACLIGISGSATVTVNPIPNATATPASQTICSNELITTIQLAGGPPGTIYNWTRNNTASVTGIAASGTGDIIGALTNTTNAPITVTFTITPIFNGCPGNPVTATVIVNPVPVASVNPPAQSRCSGVAISTFVLSSNVTGTTFSWTRDNMALVTGVPASGSGNNITGTFSNLTNAPITVTFTITPRANGCDGAPVTATVTVNPKPYINNLTESICNSGSFNVTPVDGTDGVVPAGTTYSWAIQSVTGGITGAVSGSGATISGTLGNSTNSAQTVTYAVTPSSSGCIGELFLLAVTVTPAPAISAMNANICGNGTFTLTPVNGTNGTVPFGTSYSWTTPTVTGGITGGAAGSGTNISGTLVNPTNTIQTATYTVTPSSGGSCPGTPFTVTVTVQPAPAITPMASSICSGGSFTVTPVNGTNGLVPSGTTYSWSAPAVTGGITGGTAGSGSANISGTLFNPTNSTQTATYTVTPSSGGCAGTPFTITVTVDPTPSVNPMTATICSGGNFTLTPVDGTNGKVPVGTTYSWIAPTVTGGITGGVAGSGTNISGTLVNPTNTVQTATYSVIPTSGGCSGIIFSVIITVNPVPTINPITTTVCNGTAFSITPVNGTNGIVPTGTTYSWSAPTVTGGISGGAAGSGSANISGTLSNPTNAVQTATYTITPVTGSCTGTPFEVTVTVNPIPSVTISGTTSVCYNVGTPPNITFTNPMGLPVTVTYNINGGANATVDIAANSAATVPANINLEGTFNYNLVSVAYQSAPTCPTTITGTVTITVKPITTAVISAAPAGTICSGTPVTFTATIANAGTNPTFQWYKNSAPISGETGSTFTSSTMANADKITVVVTTYDTPCPGPTTSNMITMTVNPSVTPSVTIYESANPICEGTSVTFTANPPVNGGTAPVYQWQLNGSNVGTNSTTFTTNTLVNGDQVKLILTSNALCAVNPATSNTVTMTVNPILPVSVTIAASANSVCAGTQVTYTATPVNGGTSPAFQWKVNGVNAGTSSSSYSYTPANNDVVTVVLTSNATCATGSPATSNALTMTVNPNLPVSVTIAASANPVCIGTPVTFTATPTNGGTTPAYQWKVNGVNAGTNSDTYSYTPANNDIVTVILTSNATCASGSPATSNAVTMTVNPNLPVGVTIAASANSVCAGTSVTFTATPTNGGATPAYQWKVNGVNAGTNSSTYSYTPVNNDVVTVLLTSDSPCATGSPATSNAVAMTVNPNLPVSVTIAASANPVCIGTPVTFTATPTNGGTTPAYQWKVNGVNAGTNSSTYSYTPANNDIVTVILTSNATCATGSPATSNAVTMTVNPILPVSVTIAASANSVCAGTSVTFTATPTNGGATPAYQWKVNGVNVGTNTKTYTYTPANNDVVTVELTSNAVCATGSPATSNSITLNVATSNPATPGAISGPTALCPVQTGVVYSIAPVSGASSYNWSFPAGWSITSGQGTTSVTVNANVQTTGPKTISVTATNACGSTSNSLSVNVNTFAYANAGPDQVICTGINSITLAGVIDGAVDKSSEWDWSSSGGGSFSGGGNDLTGTYTLSNADKAAGTFTITISTFDPSVACNPVSDFMVVTIIPNPTVNAGGTNTVCQSATPSAITLTGASVGGGGGLTTGAWSIISGGGSLSSLAQTATPATVTYTPAANFSGTVTLRLTTNTPGGCTAVIASRTITVNPAPTVNAGGPNTVCQSATPSAITLSGASIGGGATTGAWSIISGGGSLSTIAQTASPATVTYTPAANFSGTVTLTLTTNAPSGCSAATATRTITVNAAPTANAGGPNTVCQSATPSAITLTGASVGGSATTGAWAIASGGGSLSSLLQTATPATVTYIPVANFSGTVTLTLTTNSPGGCPAVTSTRTITVNAAPTVNAGGTITACQSASPTPISLTGASIGGGATTGAWSITSGGGNLSSTAPTTTPGTVTYTPAANFSGTVILTLTTDAPGICTAVSATRTITVNAAPTVNAGAPDIVCQSVTPSAITLTGASIGGGATTGAWSITSGGGTLSSILPTATPATVTYTPAANFSGTVTLTLTSNAPSGCSVVSATRIITVNAAPTVSAGPAQTICSGSSVTLAGTIGGGAIAASWIGGSGTFNPDRNTLTAIYTPTGAEIAAGMVTLTLTTTDPSGTCGVVSAATTITINKAVVILTQPVNTGVCAGSVADLSVIADGTNLTYQWSKDGTPISGATSSTLHFNSVSLTDNGSYSVTVSGASSCPSVISNAVTLNVDAAITISTQPVSQTKCTGDDVTFSVAASANGVPLTYQWRKDGVVISGATSSGYLITGISTGDTGNYDVVITGQAGFTCASATSTVASLQVSTGGTISLSGGSQSTTTVCVNNSLTPVTYSIGGSATGATLTGSLPAGVSGSFSGGTFTISGTPAETGTFNYTVTTTGSTCSNPSLSGTITVDGVGTISLAGGNATPVVCINNPLPTITYAIGGTATNATITPALPAGLVASYANGLFTISGTPTASGTYTFTVTTTGSACVNPSLSGVIKVNEDATIVLSSGNPNQTICIGSPISPITYTSGGSATGVALLGQLPAGVIGTYSGSVYTISGTPTASGSFNYTLTTTGLCSNNSVTGAITVDFFPDGGFISPAISTACTATNSGTLTLSSYVGNVIQWESSVDGGATWTIHPVTTDTYTYTNIPSTTLFTALVGNTNCPAVYSGISRVTVIPAFTPTITVSGGDVCSGEPVTLTGNAIILPVTTGVITGGDFNSANPKGWRVSRDGVFLQNFPARNSNENPGPWAETTNSKTFCGTDYDSADKKFAIVSGPLTSTMETPVFSLVAMSSAELSFKQAYHLSAGTIARVELSTDGGNTYNHLLASYSGTLNSGNPNIINDIDIDLSSYLGMENLRIRFNYSSSTSCNVWAVDGITLPSPQPDVNYAWGPIELIPGGSGSTVVVLPPTTTTYTLTVWIAGCPGSATEAIVTVVNNPEVQTTNACVGGAPVTFTYSNTIAGGTWSVTGGGSITSAGVFTATEPGCFVATYTTPSGGCSGSASFVVFPAAPAPTVNTGCGPIIVTPPPTINGFNIEYSFDGGITWGPNIPPTADNCSGYHIKTRYITAALCDLTLVGATSSCSESVEVIRKIDFTPPTFTVPANISISKDANCNYDASIAITGDVTDELDNCSIAQGATYTDVVLPGACDGEEIITRTWSLIDDCGNQTVHVQTITVADNNVPPTFTVPGAITINRDAACNYDASVGKTGDVTDESDNCDNGPLEAVYSDAIDNTGLCALIITRTWSLTDDCGNTNTQTQIITIVDNSVPVITCPAVAFGTTDDNECYSTTVVLGTPTATGDCSTVTVTNDAPAQFPAGTTTVTWTATDACGNTATCTQLVIVTDTNQPPTITCPASVEETIAADQCSKTGVTPGLPTISDNCPNPVLTYSLTGATTGSGAGTVSNTTFNVGVTTITYTVTDAGGGTASCSFTVWIKRLDIPAASIQCPGSPAPVNVTSGCSAMVTVDSPVITDVCQTATYTMINDYTGTATATANYPVGTTTVTWTITDNSGNVTTCVQTVTVIDNQAPAFTSCPPSVTETIAADQCTKTDVTISAPVYTDNCSSTLTYTIVDAIGGTTSGTGIISSSYPFEVGTNTVTYVVTDAGGLTATCTFTVTIRRLNIPPASVQCPGSPAPVNVVSGCEAMVTVNSPLIIDICRTATFTVTNDYTGTDNASGSYPVGTTTVTWTIRDNSGNVTTCVQTVTVIDNQPPTFAVCPPSVTETIAADQCTKTDVTIVAPQIGDNCSSTLTYTIVDAIGGTTSGTGIISSSYPFEVGTNTVTYVVTDAGGLTATCTFTVTIRRLNIPPASVQCPGSPAPVNVVSGCEAMVTVNSPLIIDICRTATFTVTNDYTGTDNASGSYPVGTTTVTWTITDNSGNVTTCVQTVTVIGIPPVIDCPDDITAPADFEKTYKEFVTVDPPVVALNCPIESLTWIMAGATTDTSSVTGTNTLTVHSFNLGVTSVTYTVTDANGNSASCTFTVTIIGKPIIDCPATITSTTDPGVCTKALDPGVPTLRPGSPPATSWSWVMTGATTGSGGNNGSDPLPISPNPFTFNAGVTTITWTACNISGCSTPCTQEIIVEDKEPPTFTSAPITECVDLLVSAVYTRTSPNPNSGIDPNLIVNPSPDFYTFKAGDTSLDLTLLDDNCCSTASLTVHWRIEFADVPDPLNPTGPVLTHPDITGTGQPSAYGSDILMWGNGVNYTPVTHSIFYWVVDCNGNSTLDTIGEQREEITITPRPEIIKMN